MNKIIITLAMSLLCLNAFANTTTATTTTAAVTSKPSSEWVEGARVEIIEVQNISNLGDAPSIAEYYDSKGSPWDAIKIKKENNASWFKSIPGLRISGYLNITEQGVHTLVADLETNKIRGYSRQSSLTCQVLGSLEGNGIINISHTADQDTTLQANSEKFHKTPGALFNVQDAVRLDLEPGKYKLITTIGCVPNLASEKKWYSPWKPKEFKLGLRLKTPTSKGADFISSENLLHKEN